ncbi:hypothetical protein SOVF_157780 [Spinacia oleracea]|nr:hypothetical protein SOVF_157780 [Spinacia oleracea]
MFHTRTKKRRSHATQGDILSDLPRDVIHEICERLPLRDAARMSVLSHKWLDIWTSTPHLAFDYEFFCSVLKGEAQETLKFGSIVSKILFQHEGPIHKFSLSVPPLKSCPDVAQWISYLSRNGLREFRLSKMDDPRLKLNLRLFSCCDLEKLKDLIGKSPLLQNLVLTNFNGMEERHIAIDAPNLRHLNIDWLFESLDVKSCENLVSVSVGWQRWQVKADRDDDRKIHKASLCNVVEVLANSSKLERLCLRGHFCKVLFKAGGLQYTFEKLKSLELLIYSDDLPFVVNCIQSFPNIETLKITVLTCTNLPEHVLDYNPDTTLHHLSYAKVEIVSASSTELKVIEFLLACSPVLEKLYVHPRFHDDEASKLIRMLMQSNRLRRASRMVEVIWPENLLPKISVQVATSSSSTSGSSSESFEESSDSE